MLSKQRQIEITECILKEGKAYVTNLANTYNVSTETIRRDLNEICKNEKIKKVHGGAISISRPFREESYEKRLSNNYEEKTAIAKCCAKYIKDNDIIAIDNGSNAECLANEIFGVKNIKIITNSIPVASILIKKYENGDFTGEIILIGGKLDIENQCGTETLAILCANKLFIDKAFIGATGISQHGITSWDDKLGMVTELIIKNSGQTYILAESEKFTRTSFYKICEFSQIEKIITDDKNRINQNIIDAIGKEKIEYAKV